MGWLGRLGLVTILSLRQGAGSAGEQAKDEERGGMQLHDQKLMSFGYFVLLWGDISTYLYP